jgi:hypothetical protein
VGEWCPAIYLGEGCAASFFASCESDSLSRYTEPTDRSMWRVQCCCSGGPRGLWASSPPGIAVRHNAVSLYAAPSHLVCASRGSPHTASACALYRAWSSSFGSIATSTPHLAVVVLLRRELYRTYITVNLSLVLCVSCFLLNAVMTTSIEDGDLSPYLAGNFFVRSLLHTWIPHTVRGVCRIFFSTFLHLTYPPTRPVTRGIYIRLSTYGPSMPGSGRDHDHLAPTPQIPTLPLLYLNRLPVRPTERFTLVKRSDLRPSTSWPDTLTSRLMESSHDATISL